MQVNVMWKAPLLRVFPLCSISTEGAVTILLVNSLLAAQSDLIKYNIILPQAGQKTP